MRSTRRSIAIAILWFGGCASSRPVTPSVERPPAAGEASEPSSWTHEELARSDVLGFLKASRDHYVKHVRDYRCTFKMRERAGTNLGDQQVMAIKFRERPYSVDMTWIENPAGAKRISYVEDRWVNDGKQLALVVPAGIANIVVPGGIKLDIHGREFKKESNRSVDQFGFRKTLERAIRLCEQAQGDPAFSLTYAGRGDFEGRPQYILERRLPYSEGGGAFPDRLAVFFLDEEWLTPTAVWSYADEDKQRPLGEFITTDVDYNVGLTDKDFE